MDAPSHAGVEGLVARAAAGPGGTPDPEGERIRHLLTAVGADPDAPGPLADALTRPTDAAARESAARHLLREAERRPELMALLTALTVPQPPGPARPSGASDSAHRNTLSGDARIDAPVVQGRDFTGPVHLSTVHVHPAPPPAAAAPGPPPAAPVPRQLPAVTGYFTGREADLRALDGLVGERAEGAGALVVISAAGGAGKTTLACAWLRTPAVADAFPDGLLYADLRGDASPAPPEEILGRLVRGLGAVSVPAGRDELMALWRTVTAGRRLAVLLDNAYTAAQVRPLLPGGSDTLTVVTSRYRLNGLALEGARFHPLGPLAPEAGLALLGRGIGEGRAAREAHAARRIVELCAGLPLAVCLAAARLAARPRGSVQGLADALDERPLSELTVGGAAVRNALDASYAVLSEDAARLYRRLGALPTRTFDGEVAAAVGALPRDEAERLLDELVEANLVEDAGPDRCRFHDLVRAHARERATEEPPGVREDVMRRACEWYLRAASAAARLLAPEQPEPSRDYRHDDLVAPVFPSGPAALAWLDAHHAGLMTCVREAAARDWHAVGWQLVDAAWAFFHRVRHYDLWIEAHEIAVRCARADGDPVAERRMLSSGAIGLSAAGRYGDAARWYGEVLTAARTAGDTRDEGQALLGLGACAYESGRPTEAREHLRRAYAVWEACGYRRGVGLVVTLQGEVALALDDPPGEIRALEHARDTFAAVNDPHNAARAVALLGRARTRAGDTAAGVAELRQALGVFSASGAVHWEARTQEMLGDAEVLRGDPAAARDHLVRAAGLYARTDPGDERRVRDRLAEPTA